MVQTLEMHRASYVLGRSAASAKIVVPHDSVSRQHAAVFFGRQGPAGATPGALSVHVADLGSTKGTYIDLGAGWVRLAPAGKAFLLPPGGRVRLGDCPTRLVYPHPTPAVDPAAAAAAAAVLNSEQHKWPLPASAVLPSQSAAPPTNIGPSLPPQLVGRPLSVIETPQGSAGASSLPDDVAAGDATARIVGTVTFSGCFAYDSRDAWVADERAARLLSVRTADARTLREGPGIHFLEWLEEGES